MPSIPVQFAQENEQLFEHVNTMVDEVRQIEGKVIEISKLQELFSQHVLQQVECSNYVWYCCIYTWNTHTYCNFNCTCCMPHMFSNCMFQVCFLVSEVLLCTGRAD